MIDLRKFTRADDVRLNPILHTKIIGAAWRMAYWMHCQDEMTIFFAYFGYHHTDDIGSDNKMLGRLSYLSSDMLIINSGSVLTFSDGNFLIRPPSNKKLKKIVKLLCHLQQTHLKWHYENNVNSFY